MTPEEYRAALDRLGFKRGEFGHAIKALGDERTLDDIQHRLQDLKHPRRLTDIPWAVAALVRMFERERILLADIAEMKEDIENLEALCEAHTEAAQRDDAA